MQVNLVIPRHKYRSLQDGRQSLSLSPEGTLALNELATCSKSAAADLAIRVLHAVIFGNVEQLDSVAADLVAVTDQVGLARVHSGFGWLERKLREP